MSAALRYKRGDCTGFVATIVWLRQVTGHPTR